MCTKGLHLADRYLKSIVYMKKTTTSAWDDPHTVSLHTETSTDTAENSQSSPSIRDDGNNTHG